MLRLLIAILIVFNGFDVNASLSLKKSCAYRILKKVARVGGVMSLIATGSCAVNEQIRTPSPEAQTASYQSRLGEGDLFLAHIGDSLSTSFYASSEVRTVARSRYKLRQGNWFLDTDGSHSSPESVFEKLAVPRRLRNFAVPRATIDGLPDQFHNDPTSKLILRTADLSDQVDQILRQEKFPNVVSIWIGANNLDWPFELKQYGTVPPDYDFRRDPSKIVEGHLKASPAKLVGSERKWIKKLIEKAELQPYPVAIVVFALPDVTSYFQGLEEAKKVHQSNPNQFTYVESVYEHFEAFRPEYRVATSQLAVDINQALAKMVEEENAQIKGSVRVFFSTALHEVKLSDPRKLHPVDAFHPSKEGHDAFAEAAARAYRPALMFANVAP